MKKRLSLTLAACTAFFALVAVYKISQVSTAEITKTAATSQTPIASNEAAKSVDNQLITAFSENSSGIKKEKL